MQALTPLGWMGTPGSRADPRVPRVRHRRRACAGCTSWRPGPSFGWPACRFGARGAHPRRRGGHRTREGVESVSGTHIFDQRRSRRREVVHPDHTDARRVHRVHRIDTGGERRPSAGLDRGRRRAAASRNRHSLREATRRSAGSGPTCAPSAETVAGTGPSATPRAGSRPAPPAVSRGRRGRAPPPVGAAAGPSAAEAG
jgi:hypothetical protein